MRVFKWECMDIMRYQWGVLISEPYYNIKVNHNFNLSSIISSYIWFVEI